MWEQAKFGDISAGDIIRWTHEDGEIIDCGRAKKFHPGRHYDTWEMEDGHELYEDVYHAIERLS